VARRSRARIERRLHAPDPRLALGAALRRAASSAIDISDGLVADLGHICRRSNVAAEVELGRIPVSATLRGHRDRAVGRAAMLSGGDDYELAFTAPRHRRAAVSGIARRLRIRLTRIGRVIPARRNQPPVTVLGPDGRAIALAQTGYKHF
jgi:thiamine-monophosphate kinase